MKNAISYKIFNIREHVSEYHLQFNNIILEKKNHGQKIIKINKNMLTAILQYYKIKYESILLC